MYTYAIQTLTPSGDVYVTEYDGDTIHAIAGPLHHTEVAAAVANPATMPDWEFEDPGELTDSEWGFPLATYDPTTRATN